MLYKTRGIVLRYTRFKETSIIATLFTEQFGLHAYIVNNVRAKKTTAKIALYQPLTLLDLVVYHRPHQSISRIKEIKCLYPYETLSTNFHKASIALFLNEVLNKSIKEESHPKDLYEFLQHALISFDRQENNYQNFHLIFLLKLSRYLGFGANRADEIMADSIAHTVPIQTMNNLLEADYNTSLSISYSERKQILQTLIDFYASHIGSFSELRSLLVVQELMSV